MGKKWKVWIDTGGTFTDCLAKTPDGAIKRVKVLSSSRLRGKALAKPAPNQLNTDHALTMTTDVLKGYTLVALGHSHPAVEVTAFDAVKGLITLSGPLGNHISCPFDFELSAGEEAPVLAARLVTETPLTAELPPMDMRLGTTKGTNALLERKGAKTAWLITKGFKDLISIGTQQRPDIFGLKIEKPLPLYHEVVEITERVSATGCIITPIDQENVRNCLLALLERGTASVAVSFLNAYKNPVHEQLVASLCDELGIQFKSISTQLFPAIKLLPRAETAVADAYLNPLLSRYLVEVKKKLGGNKLKVMTSAGGLAEANEFYARDSLLSGPAGGVIGAAEIAAACGEDQILTLDMGGTSTDVSRYAGKPDYRFECEVGSVKIASPSVAVETVAAGGGSVCSFDGLKLRVGPESAGAYPGPACYGAGGPLTITDVNLLLGRADEQRFGIPLQKQEAEKRFEEQLREIEQATGQIPNPERLLEGYLQIANERMAEAITGISTRKGFDPAAHALLAFGGAGGQHACAVAELLDIKKIIVPYDAGLLSAFGIGKAVEERIVKRQVLLPLVQLKNDYGQIMDEITAGATELLAREGVMDTEVTFAAAYLRFRGQDAVIEVETTDYATLSTTFEEKYRQLFGHWVPNREIEVESIAVKVSGKKEEGEKADIPLPAYSPETNRLGEIFSNGRKVKAGLFDWNALRPGALISGPALVASHTSTMWVEENWEASFTADLNAIIKKAPTTAEHRAAELHETVALELFTNRFRGIAEEMGALLMRTAFSVNIKERLDFSCALLDADGELVVNAPHIPVHLGGLGLCVRKVLEVLPLKERDVAVTNHPGFGGSHLPDITLVAPVFVNNQLVGYVANRAHHSELGGKRPGSMPPDAKNLLEEGVVISPMLLVKGGSAQWDKIEEVLLSAPYPTRALAENLADLNAALSAVVVGQSALKILCEKEGLQKVLRYMAMLKQYSHEKLWEKLASLKSGKLQAEEALDDGSKIKVKVERGADHLEIDFAGSAPVHKGNLNATPAIVRSAVIYVLRLLINENIPLNEGIMKHVNIVLPEGMLNPPFPPDPTQCPAVVGGNTEVSQRLVDTLIKAFGLSACSQGTMNNLLFGNDHFGYYETICGGTGAGPGFDGADAVHHHMTNTRITDPEIMEWRYPVKVEEFSIRQKSGGDGKWSGGNGVVRKLRFTEPVQLTILSQHRVEKPFGMDGGNAGATGNQWIENAAGETTLLKGVDAAELNAGEAIVVETPGGGGWGRG